MDRLWARRAVGKGGALAYQGTYKFDVFISYGRVDDKPLHEGVRGWVSHLHDTLLVMLEAALGREGIVNLHFDSYSIRGNRPISDVRQNVGDTAILLTVLSPGFFGSTYCVDHELGHFLKRPGGIEGDIFPLFRTQLDHDSLPPPLNSITGYPFWSRNEDRKPETYGLIDRNDIRFYKAVDKLGTDIVERLKEISNSARITSPPSINTDSNTIVYLAEVTDDLEPERDSVVSYLSQYGISVCPADSYPRPGFTAPMERDMERSAAFIQLLSKFSGKTYPDAPQGLPWLQVKKATNLGMPIYQWCSPDLVLDQTAGPQSSLLKSHHVQMRPLEEFKESIRKQIQAPKPVVHKVRERSVYINHDRTDTALSQQLSERLSTHLDVETTPFNLRNINLRKAKETKMLECESVVFLYGNAKSTWIDRELNAFRALASERSKPRAQVVIQTPPNEKPDPTVRLRDSSYMRATGGINDKLISELVDILV